MGALTEQEIFGCLSANFKLAAEHCDDLAKLPRKGPTYRKLREELKLLEGACRQAAHWRGDARWLRIGLYMEEVHKRAGNWLRACKHQGTLHPLFTKLAENMREGQKAAERLRTARTGRVGLILPKPGRPIERRTPGGLILPSGMAA